MSVTVPVVDSWNGETRRVYLKQGVTAFHWIDDIYKEYRYWRRTDETARVWDPLMVAAGNNPKGGGKYTPRYITLLDGCRVIPYDENILIVVTGEAITDNADIDPDPFDTSTRTQALKLYITPPASELVRAEAEIAAVNRMSYDEGVTIDEVNGVLGTDGLKGNREFPVRLISDALIIAQANALSKFYIKGNLTLGLSDDVAGYSFMGEDTSSTLLTLPAGTPSGISTIGCKLHNLTLIGTCRGRMDIIDCHLSEIVGLCATGGDANIVRCMLSNNIQMKNIADQAYNFVDCYGSAGVDAPVIDANGCPADINFSNYTGPISIKNATNPAQNISIDMNAGHITLESTVTQGDISVRGIAKFINNTTAQPGLALDASGLLKPVDDQYGKRIYLSTAGLAGQEFPRGLFDSMVDNFPDALALADKYNCNDLHIHSDITVPSGTVLDYFVNGGHIGNILTFETGCITNNLKFENITISGELNGQCEFHNCHLKNVTGVEGTFFNCTFEGTITAEDGGMLHITGGRSHTQEPAVLSIGTAMVNAINLFGVFTITNKTGIMEVNMHFGFGMVTVADSCTEGSIYLAGSGQSIDNSNGAVVVSQMVDPAAGGSLTTEQNTMLTDLHDEALGKWVVDPQGNTLTLYRADGITVLKTFNLISTGNSVPTFIQRTPV